MSLAELCDGLCDDGLPRTSTVKPHNEGLRVPLLPDPLHGLVQGGFPGVFVTFRLVMLKSGFL